MYKSHHNYQRLDFSKLNEFKVLEFLEYVKENKKAFWQNRSQYSSLIERLSNENDIFSSAGKLTKAGLKVAVLMAVDLFVKGIGSSKLRRILELVRIEGDDKPSLIVRLDYEVAREDRLKDFITFLEKNISEKDWRKKYLSSFVEAVVAHLRFLKDN